jgi:hypothetical protein
VQYAANNNNNNNINNNNDINIDQTTTLQQQHNNNTETTTTTTTTAAAYTTASAHLVGVRIDALCQIAAIGTAHNAHPRVLLQHRAFLRAGQYRRHLIDRHLFCLFVCYCCYGAMVDGEDEYVRASFSIEIRCECR